MTKPRRKHQRKIGAPGRLMGITRFDKLEFDILDVVNLGMYSSLNPMRDRALIMMSEGILQANPLDNWPRSGWKFTDKGKLYYAKFLQDVRVRHGHQWQTHRDSYPDLYSDDEEYANEIDIFAYSNGYHNGMVCKACGFSFCQHCQSEFEIEECPITKKDRSLRGKLRRE